MNPTSLSPAMFVHRERAGRTSAETAQDGTQQQAAWLREMERAQFGAWFRTGSPSDGGAPAAAQTQLPDARPPGVDRPDSETSTSARGGESSARSCDAPAAPPSSPGDPLAADAPRTVPGPPARVDAPLASCSIGPQRGGLRGESGPTVPGQTPAGEAPPRAASVQAMAMRLAFLPVLSAVPAADMATEPATHAAAPAAAAPAPAASEAPPFHLHIEPRPQGQAVWVALPAADAASPELQALVLNEVRNALRRRDETLCQLVCNGQLIWAADRSDEPASRAHVVTPVAHDRTAAVAGVHAASARMYDNFNEVNDGHRFSE